jgi:hypothetical protein
LHLSDVLGPQQSHLRGGILICTQYAWVTVVVGQHRDAEHQWRRQQLTQGWVVAGGEGCANLVPRATGGREVELNLLVTGRVYRHRPSERKGFGKLLILLQT